MHSSMTIALVTLGFAIATVAVAEPSRFVNERQIQRTLRQAFPLQPEAWQTRLAPDSTMSTCVQWKNNPPKEIADNLKKYEAERINLPSDGQFLGDWRSGEKIAHSGYGMRFTDTDKERQNGGNCYACHELSPDEVSFGTLGVSLKRYGRLHKFDPATARAVYEKIFNSQAVVACSTMPRFGFNGILTIEQIKDVVAYLMHPDSPVNKEPETPAGDEGKAGDASAPGSRSKK